MSIPSPPKDPNITPALKPPPGVTSNLINPPSRGYITLIVFITYLGVTTPMVCLRMYVRRFINRKVWWDDWACVLGWIGLVVLAGCLIKSIDWGNGTDQWNVSIANVGKFVLLFQKLEIIARVSIFFTKLSILLLFIRTFIPINHQKNNQKKKSIFYAIWIVIWFNLLYCVSLVLVLILQCVGKKEVAGQSCVDSFALFIASSVINVITDMVMLAIPLVAIWDLHMATRRKVGIGAIFAVGIAALGSSLARLAWQLRHAQDTNRTVVLQKVSLLAIAEHAIGLIVACMPIIPAFFRHLKSNRRTIQASSSLSKTAKESWKPSLGSNSLSYRTAATAAGRRLPPRGSTKDPYLLSGTGSRDYKELDDLESANGLLMMPPPPAGASSSSATVAVDAVDVDDDIGVVKGGGTTTTIIDGGGGGGGNNGGNSGGERMRSEVMVSRSVQVESHPIGRGPGSGLNVMPPAHLKR